MIFWTLLLLLRFIMFVILSDLSANPLSSSLFEVTVSIKGFKSMAVDFLKLLSLWVGY